MLNKFITLSACLLIFQFGYSQTKIQMKREGEVSVIPCKVNGLVLNLIFDTGASDVSLSNVEALFMLKNGYLTIDDILGSTNYMDASGNINEGVSLNLKEIEIAGLKLYNVKASIVKNNLAPLLLGQSAISKLGGIQLDLNNNTLIILNGQDNTFDFSGNKIDNNIDKSRSSIIGNSFKLGNLEIAQFDFKEPLNWQEAQKAVKNLGQGWRLPGRVELDDMFKVRKKIGANQFYWSSVVDESGSLAWGRNFAISSRKGFSSKANVAYIRAVRNL
jgi:clan AA aspartic protease (TIGR02281 family)